MPNTQKSTLVDDLKQSISETSNFALIKFEKTTHKGLEALRKDLKKQNTFFKVVKNTLFEKTINKLSESEKAFTDIRKKAFPLKDKSAVLVFKGEWAEGLKNYYTKTKEDENFSFKFGYLDSTIYEQGDMVKLAQLPGKDQLMAKIIGSMKNPMARTTRALTFNMQKLVYVLTQKSQQSS
jgi:large subunit ribosomal protein L10